MNLVETGGCRLSLPPLRYGESEDREVEAQEGARVEPCKAWFPSLKKSIY